MIKRLAILFFAFALGVGLLPTAVSQAIQFADSSAADLSAASPPAALVPHVPNDPPYLILLPNCGDPTADPGPVKLHVLFEEWPTNQSLTLYWDGDLLQSWQANGHNSSFSQAITRMVPQQAMTHTVTAVSGSGTTITQTFTVPCEPGITAVPPVERDVFTSRTQDSGIFATSSAAVFGPDICTAYGDPFSPLNSLWAPGFYTYHYRIRIPASYAHDIVRVELFNPDSINVLGSGPFTIVRTQAAQAAGLPATTTGSCPSGGPSNRKNPCLIPTGELPLAQNGTLPLERINPWWFIRTDENRGTGVSGQCGQPNNYDPTRNTATLYQLYYFQDDGNATSRVNLAAYTGQTGDGVRDNGDHDTDMRWVSPGAGQSYDQPVFVPTDPGSPGDFEIDLNAELPNVVTDPQTGDRYVYLDVTALSGASENSFEIWAGPPVYTSTIPSRVNERNLAALNSPHSHDSQGVTVFAIQNLPQNSNFSDRIEIPLTYVGPEYAGQEISVTMFDPDSGAAPPITFYFDTMAESDWSMTFAQSGVPDPDGEVRNCVPGTCNDMWITPPYHITIPGDLANCDFSNPQNDPDCIPFPGGRLMVSYDGGLNDTYQWEVTPPTLTPNDPTVGCAAFPIAIHEGIYSVTPPGTGSNPFPDPDDFDPGTGGNQYPIPTYEQFFNHVPDVPLLEAQEGYVYRVWNGFGNGNFGWLRWNEGLASNASNLTSSLEWPGNSLDYTDYPIGDPNAPQGQAVPGSGFSWPVWGYIEPGDPIDQQMHMYDWVAANTGVTNASYLEETLVGHINNQRVLRLLIWDIADGQGNNGRFHISRFGLFRLAGYNLVPGWLLFEFIGWDDSCGQTEIALAGVDISGPTTGIISTTYSFTAVASPHYATQPITYVWELAGQSPITHTNGVTDVLTASWPVTGTYMLTVTAVNAITTSSPVSSSHQIVIGGLQPDLTIIGPPQLLTPLPVGAHQPVSFTVTVANTGDVDGDSKFLVDIFLDPTVVLTTGIPISESSGFISVPALAAGESVTVTILAQDGFADEPLTHTVYAMVDSLAQIGESDETNNLSASLIVTDVHPLLAGVTLAGPVLGLPGETYTFTAVVTPTITDPITYTWFLDGTPTLTMTNGTAVTTTLTWPITGTFELLVIADNSFNAVTDTHTIVITDTPITDLAVVGPLQLLTPGPIQPNQPVSFTVLIANLGNVPITDTFYVDITLDPDSVLTDTVTAVPVNGLMVGENQLITILAPAGITEGAYSGDVFAVVDSWQQIAEADETNNLSDPFVIDIAWRLYFPFIHKP